MPRDDDQACKSTITMQIRREVMRNIDNLIARLTEYQVLKGQHAQITENEVVNLCLLTAEVLMEDPVYLDLDLNQPLYVLGDIFGQYTDLLRIFNFLGHPPNQRYLFLGNFVNRGTHSIETFTLLFAYKIRYPKHIYLLRGKHECEYVSRHYGLYDECVKRYTRRMWQNVVSTFTYMPVVASIEGSIFCVHSGLSPTVHFANIHKQSQFKTFVQKMIIRPTEVHTNVLETHFLWSAPEPDIKAWAQNPAGLAYYYGPSVVQSFCEKLGFQQIIRSSELFEQGYDFFIDQRLLSIFTAPHFMGGFKNKGAIVHMVRGESQDEVICSIKVIKPLMKMRSRMTGRMNIAIHDSMYTEPTETI